MSERSKASDHGDTYVPQTAPPRKVNERLVGKAFFMAAAKCWIKNQTFSFKSRHLRVPSIPGHDSELLAKYISKAELELLDIGNAGRRQDFPYCEDWPLPNLKSVTVAIPPSSLGFLDPIKPEETDLVECKIFQIVREFHIHRMTGTRKFTMEAQNYRSFSRVVDREPIWEINVARIGTMIEPIVTRPRDTVWSETSEIEENHSTCKGRCRHREALSSELTELWNKKATSVFDDLLFNAQLPSPSTPLYPGSKESW